MIKMYTPSLTFMILDGIRNHPNGKRIIRPAEVVRNHYLSLKDKGLIEMTDLDAEYSHVSITKSGSDEHSRLSKKNAND